MRKWICALMIVASPFVHPSLARADVPLPTAAEQQQALEIAATYWKHAPTWNGCGPVGQTFSANLPTTWEATVDYTSCNIVYADWAMTYGNGPSWETFCATTVHEYGHLVLGPTYFAATNPSNPAHSPDPNNIMYSGGIIPPPQCQPPAAPASAPPVLPPSVAPVIHPKPEAPAASHRSARRPKRSRRASRCWASVLSERVRAAVEEEISG